MEHLPAWPDSVFLEESILELENTGLPLRNKNKEIKSTVGSWKNYREAALFDIENATEIVQVGLENAKEFLDCKTLSDPRVEILKKQCEDHDNKMTKITEDLLTYKSKEFMKKYPLGEGAKEYIKEEFQRITKHIKLHQKCVHSQLAMLIKKRGNRR